MVFFFSFFFVLVESVYALLGVCGLWIWFKRVEAKYAGVSMTAGTEHTKTMLKQSSCPPCTKFFFLRIESAFF